MKKTTLLIIILILEIIMLFSYLIGFYRGINVIKKIYYKNEIKIEEKEN